MIKHYFFAFFVIFTANFQPIVPSSAQAMGWEEGSPEKIALHAAVGAAVAAVADGDVLSGASAAALNEALLPHLTKALEEAGLDGVLDKDAILVLASQAVGGLVGGTDGAVITGNATEHNYLNHKEALEREQAREACASGDSAACDRANELDQLDEERDRVLLETCATGNRFACVAKVNDLFAALQTYHTDPQAEHGNEAAYREVVGDALGGLMAEYEGSARVREITHEIIRQRSSAELGQMLKGFDLGAVGGASAAVITASAIGGVNAARTIITTCGRSPQCYAHYGQKLLAEIGASPELGGTGISVGVGASAVDDFIRNNPWKGAVDDIPTTVDDLGKIGDDLLSKVGDDVPDVGGANRTVSVESGKFDYLFGRVISGTHNTARSQQMKTELARVGVHDTPAGRKVITDHLDDVVKDPSNITGTFTKTIDGQVLNFEIRQSLFSGPGGFLQFNSTFRVNADGTRSLSTIIPKGGN